MLGEVLIDTVVSASAGGGSAQVPQVQCAYAESVLDETGTQKSTKDQDSGFSLGGVSGGKQPNKGASTFLLFFNNFLIFAHIYIYISYMLPYMND